jgi:hypothetical protein
MRINQKRLMAVAMITLPLASVMVAAGPAFASTPTATGSLTCAEGGSIDFSPSLTFNGTVGSKEVVTFDSLSFSGCTSEHSVPPTAPTASASVKTKTIKLKGVACQGTKPTQAYYDAACSNGKPLMTGSCSDFSGELSTVTLSSATKWNTKIKPTKGSVSHLTQDLTEFPYLGSTGSGTSTGSYGGSVSTTTIYSLASSTDLLACKSGSETPLASLTIDSAKSTITEN